MPEVNRALEKSGDLDIEKAGTEAARNLLPFVESETRRDTGFLQSSWIADQGSFINYADYAVYQEFGTRSVQATNAIRKAVDAREEVLTEAFGKEAQNAGAKAGFDR